MVMCTEADEDLHKNRGLQMGPECKNLFKKNTYIFAITYNSVNI